jgi:tRNA1Val (adenine37-N6)-methyltransferase
VEPKRAEESVDGLLRNKIRVIQALRGHRVSEDALILAWFVRPRPGEFILDAGTGCGVIAFALAVKEPTVKVIGVEIQAALANRAGRGASLNQLESRVCFVRGDIRQAHRFFGPECFDVVVSNPPYHEAGRGHVSTEHERALSRHQLMMPLEDLFRVSGKLLVAGGRLSFIYPASGMDRTSRIMHETGFEPARMLWIHPHKGAGPGLVCIESRRRSTDEAPVEEHLYLYEKTRVRTREAEAILAGEEIPRG